MKFVALVTLLFSLLIIASVDAAKKKKYDKSVSRRPSDVDPHHYCAACKAIPDIILKKIRNSRKETDIYDVLTDVCHYNNFPSYDYPPPKMMKGCIEFINGREELIAELLMERETNEEVEQKLCFDITKACVDLPPQQPTQYGNEGIQLGDLQYGGDPNDQIRFGNGDL